MSTFDLSGRSALVTGGARGLGAGMAAALTEAGARVMIADVLKDVGEQTAAELPGCGFVELDVGAEVVGESEGVRGTERLEVVDVRRRRIVVVRAEALVHHGLERAPNGFGGDPADGEDAGFDSHASEPRRVARRATTRLTRNLTRC